VAERLRGAGPSRVRADARRLRRAQAQVRAGITTETHADEVARLLSTTTFATSCWSAPAPAAW
jgi:hypothetical protein